MNTDKKKLEDFIVILEVYSSQGFIDGPPSNEFDSTVMSWLVDAGLASIPEGREAEEELWLSISGTRGENPVLELKSILEEIAGRSAEEILQERLKDRGKEVR